VLAAQAAWSLWACRDRLREPLIANGLIVLLYLPWLPHLRGKALSVIGTFEPLTAGHVATDVTRLIPGYAYASLRQIPTYLGLAAIGACLVVGLFGLALSRWRASGGGGRARSASHLALLSALAVATPIGLFLYSLLVTDLWLARGLYASVPAAVLVLAALLVRLPRPLSAVTVTVVLATLLFGTVRALNPNFVRTPFRAIAAYLDRVAGPNDPIIEGSSVGAPAITAQMHRPHRVLPNGFHVWDLVPPGSIVYVVVDDDFARFYKVGTPRPEGFLLLAKRHYAGFFPTDLVTYRKAYGAR
jgi:hypothetical protein